MNHLRKHWHHHLSVWGTALSVAVLLVGGGSAAAVLRHLHGGWRFSHHGPPRIEIRASRGGHLPASWSLARGIVRVHDQGNSSSCVGQTLSTIEEITAAERGRPAPFSSGYIYDQINGGRDEGASYSDAFSVLTRQGDPHLADFPHDGVDWWVLPEARTQGLAWPYRSLSWRSIDPSDTYTIMYELSHGRPLALALPVRDTFYNHFNTALPLLSDTGAYHFGHSITAVGYSTLGLQVLNSWGRAWGEGGITTLEWSYMRSVTYAMVVSIPRPVPPRPVRQHLHPRSDDTPAGTTHGGRMN